MSSVSVVGNATVQLLKENVGRAASATVGAQTRAGAGKGEQVSIRSILDLAASSAKVIITEALFDTTTSPTQRKLALFEKTGEALGVEKKNYASDADYRAAIKDAFSKLKADDDYSAIAETIEANLGLTKLGLSLETAVKALLYPNGDEDRALTSALTIHDRLHTPARPSGSRIPALSLDTLGLYRVAR